VKIVIAAWHLKDFNVGLGRYARGLIQGLADLDSPHEYEILMPCKPDGFPARSHLRYRQVSLPVFKRRLWEQVAPLLSGPYDILHFLYDSCILWKRGKFISTIHDMKPVLFDLGKVGPTRLERWLVKDRRTWIDHVITDSDSSRADIVKLLDRPVEHISVVYPGVDLERFRQERPDRDTPDSRSKGRRPYVLCVAGADPTKNVESLIDAFAHLPRHLRDSHDLVLAGDFRRRQDIRDRASQKGIGDRTIFPGVVPDAALIDLYQHAAVFVFPSRYEGFGLPVLEAMACACPVISSNVSSLPEVTGDAALLRHPDDVEGMAADIERVLTDQELAGRLQRQGLARAAMFSWQRTARGMVSVYEHVLKR
jgi:glycosyltransferase involved in cell wall biosynthesis